MPNNNDDFVIDSMTHNNKFVTSTTISNMSDSIRTNINDIQSDVDYLKSSINSLNNYCVELDTKNKIALSDINSKYSNTYNKIRMSISGIEFKLRDLDTNVNNLDAAYTKLKCEVSDLNDKHKHLYELHNSEILHLTNYIESISNNAVYRYHIKQCNSKIYIGDIMICSEKHFSKFTRWILKKLFKINITNINKEDN